jgi:hypothetical protein
MPWPGGEVPIQQWIRRNNKNNNIDHLLHVGSMAAGAFHNTLCWIFCLMDADGSGKANWAQNHVVTCYSSSTENNNQQSPTPSFNARTSKTPGNTSYHD